MKDKRINELKIVDKLTVSDIDRDNFKAGIIKLFFIITFFIILGISGYITNIIIDTSADFPDVAMLDVNKDQTTIIYDVHDKPIANIHGDEDRVSVSLHNISPWLQRAVIAVEDNRFYEHNGIDLTGTVRAAFNNFIGADTIQGGSTLTQQLVKNSFLSSERSIKRKFVEAIISLKVERKYTKNKILEMYLNQIYWGSLCYGAEKAAKRYFKKDAKDLTLAESAFLAGLLKAPEGYSPYSNYEGSKLRQRIVLERMEHYGYITKKQRFEAEKDKLKIYPREHRHSKYAYFVHHIINKVMGKYGNDIVRRGGLRIYTTLDPIVQEIAEKTITNGVKNLKYTGVKQGALVSIDVERAYVQALVGGVDFTESNFNRATQSKRAAGSSFKPVVYLTGFRLGKITPDSPIVDAPISFNTGWSVWSPHNWDNRFMGKMTVRRALTLSRNTPTVRVALKVGIDKIIETARLVGLKGHMDRNFSIALGSLGICPLDMATMFSTLARDGVYAEPISIRRIEDKSGNVLELNAPTPVRVVNSKYARWLLSIMVDVVDKGTGRGAKLEDRMVAGKTGTSDEIRDIWFTGSTPDTVTTIWLGNDANLPLHGAFSSNCARLWGIFSKEYYKRKDIPSRDFDLRVTDDDDDIDDEKKKKKKKPQSVAKPYVRKPIVGRYSTPTPPKTTVKPGLKQQRAYRQVPPKTYRQQRAEYYQKYRMYKKYQRYNQRQYNNYR